MKSRFQMIGYNRRVDYKWLQFTASLELQGLSAEQIHESLSSKLADELSVNSNAVRGSREKTITLLMKTWVRVAKELIPFRDAGIELLRDLPISEHRAVHWGMTMAAYPFWRNVAQVTGRLLRLQGTFSATQVQRRIREQYGQRETAYRSARYIVYALSNWEILAKTRQPGIYSQGSAQYISNPALAAWLVEASMLSRSGGRASLDEILQAPCLFPFRLRDISPNVLPYVSQRLEVVRHGMDGNLISLRDSGVGKF